MMMGVASDNGKLRISLPALLGTIANGTSVTVTATAGADIVGGFPPFTHNWTDNIANVAFQASTSVTSRIQATGTNIEHNGLYIYTITEANGVATTVSAVLIITQGAP